MRCFSPSVRLHLFHIDTGQAGLRCDVMGRGGTQSALRATCSASMLRVDRIAGAEGVSQLRLLRIKNRRANKLTTPQRPIARPALQN